MAAVVDLEPALEAAVKESLRKIAAVPKVTFDKDRSMFLYEIKRRVLRKLLTANKPNDLSHIVRGVYFMLKQSGLHFIWVRDEHDKIHAEWCKSNDPNAIKYETFVNGCFQYGAGLVDAIPPRLPDGAKITGDN